jgi:glucosylceramidase
LRWRRSAQQPGQYSQVDLGRIQHVSQLVLDTSASTWGTPVAAGAGSGQLTTISVPPRAIRYLRVVATASSPSWWSVADLRLNRGRRQSAPSSLAMIRV